MSRDLDAALHTLHLHARLAAACGALQVPGEKLASALQLGGERRLGPVRFRTSGALDRLGVVQELPIDLAEDVILAVGAELPEPWLDRVGPERIEVGIEATRDGAVSLTLAATVDLSTAAAVERVGAEGLALLLDDLLLPRAIALRWGPRGAGVTFPQPAASRVSQAARRVASEPQARWLGAMAQALGSGRTVLLTAWAGPGGAALEITFPDVQPETVLRLLDPLYPEPRAGALLGAVAAAAGERIAVSVATRSVEPPWVGLTFGR